MDEVLIKLGSKIREYRNLKGLSQDQLGELCGFHFSYIGGVERGERNITIENIAKISKALDIELSKLFEFNQETDENNLGEKQNLLNELTILLENKSVSQITMIKNIINEIFKTFSK
ncbi:UDP-N-acetylglucosamine 1-carboxyvinyltransferase [Paenibacillus nuruki]|uniref:UDP-N-acetylglucosamine 1-carboxyvinyltransferase n=1 Tax=Paenibacillus nuruki TaxID=1886670 RepID=A0A1E3L0J9_9BACL|nr:helix-turn-helix transcriptional regulator [Paenibacillus nuruki]ODP27256.1 UDP-N-acetylglucosamine 1-carboxyvinyltransferase [Paenibacillus nuruki]